MGVGHIFFFILFPAGILGNIILFDIRHVLAQKGYKTHSLYFRTYGVIKDIANFHNLIQKEQNFEDKRYYRNLLIAQYFTFLLMIGAMLLLAASFRSLR